MSYSVEADLTSGLPSGWTHRRLKEVADVIPSNVDKHSVEGQTAVRLCNYVDTYKNERITASIDFMPATATQAQIERLGLRKGDITITKDSESPWDIAVPSYVAEEIDGLVCGYHLSKISPAAGVMDGGYLSWALRSKPVNIQFALAAQGITRYGLSSSALADGVIPCPPIREQLAIASYLDAETARIDGLIDEKQRLLTLLAEAELSAIERATLPTKGMRRVPLKRFVDSLSTGPFGSALHSSDYISDGVAVINPTHIVDGVVVPDPDVSVTSDLAASLSAYRLRPGDIVVGRRGEMGRCAVVPDGCFDWLCGTGCLMLTPSKMKVLPEYLQLVVSSRASRDWLSLESVGSTMENLNAEILGRLPCFVPDLAEQLNRLSACRAELDSLASLKLHVKEEVRLLEEMRSATITDAVLGRINVREHMKH